MIGVSGVFLLILSELSVAAASWPVAAVMVVLLVAISSIVAGQTVLSRLRQGKKET